ncbi:MAG: ATP12 family protein [Salaquimonas sp.]
MRDLIFDAEAATAKSPEAAAQQHMRPVLPKRFYKSVTIKADGDEWRILLDGRTVKTPAKSVLSLPTDAAARMVADEWDAQEKEINPAIMPVTRLANTAIDGISQDPQAVLEDVVSFASNDMLFYRGSHPETLIEAQRRHWDAILDLIQAETGARFETIEGISHIAQSKEAISLFSARLAKHNAPIKLACLHTMTTLTGSALIAFSLIENLISFDTAWAAAHVDEDHNISFWGEDYEAGKRRENRNKEMMAAYQLFMAL